MNIEKAKKYIFGYSYYAHEDLTEEVRRALTIAVDSLDMWDKVVKEIKDNKPSSIDIELNGIERVGFAVGLNKAIEIIEKCKKEIEE